MYNPSLPTLPSLLPSIDGKSQIGSGSPLSNPMGSPLSNFDAPIELPPLRQVLSTGGVVLPPFRPEENDWRSRKYSTSSTGSTGSTAGSFLSGKRDSVGSLGSTNSSSGGSLSSSAVPVANNYGLGASVPKRRRQRAGPSCDSCRMRKVKCNADITVLKEIVQSGGGISSVSSSNANSIHSIKHKINPISVGISAELGYEYLETPSKIIRFRGCDACFARNVECVFSKGYTRAEIAKYNRLKEGRECS